MSIDTTAMTAGIAAVNAAISTVGTLDTAAPVVLATVYQAVQSARAPFDAAIIALDATIDQTNVGSVVPGVIGQVSAPLLLAQAAALDEESNLIVARAYLVRAGANMFNAAG